MAATAHGKGPHHHASFVIEWREGFRTGIAEVDVEHRHLFDLVKQLEPGNAQAVLDELLEYVVTHFTHEQALMENSGYPEFQQHLMLHEELAQQVLDFLGQEGGWGEARAHELRRFLNRWLVGHILTHDLRFGKWYQQHERQIAARPGQVVARPRSRWFDRLLARH